METPDKVVVSLGATGLELLKANTPAETASLAQVLSTGVEAKTPTLEAPSALVSNTVDVLPTFNPVPPLFLVDEDVVEEPFCWIEAIVFSIENRVNRQ